MIKDLSPSQRALLKIAEQALAMAFLNALIAGVAYLDDFKIISLGTLATIIVSQMLLAICTVAIKYLKASGQPMLSTLVNAAATEIAFRSPARPALSQNLQTAQNAVDDFFANDFSEPSARGSEPTPMATQAIVNDPPLKVTTLPNINAIGAK